MAAWAINAFVVPGGAMDAVPLPGGEPAGPEPLTEDEVRHYAKDLRLNFESVLTESGAPGLNAEQIAILHC